MPPGSSPRRPTRVTITSLACGRSDSSIAGHALSAMTANTSTSRRPPTRSRQLGRQRGHPGRVVRTVDDHQRAPPGAPRAGRATGRPPGRRAPPSRSHVNAVAELGEERAAPPPRCGAGTRRRGRAPDRLDGDAVRADGRRARRRIPRASRHVLPARSGATRRPPRARRSTASASAGTRPTTSGTPGFAIPAFSNAIWRSSRPSHSS